MSALDDMSTLDEVVNSHAGTTARAELADLRAELEAARAELANAVEQWRLHDEDANSLTAQLAGANARIRELESSRAELMATLAAYGNAETPNGSEYESHALDQVLSIGSIKAEHPRLYAQAVAELAALQALSAESRTLRPVACNRKCFERGWDAAQEAAAQSVRQLSGMASAYEDAIRALQPKANCDGCNPLEPDAR